MFVESVMRTKYVKENTIIKTATIYGKRLITDISHLVQLLDSYIGLFNTIFSWTLSFFSWYVHSFVRCVRMNRMWANFFFFFPHHAHTSCTSESIFKDFILFLDSFKLSVYSWRSSVLKKQNQHAFRAFGMNICFPVAKWMSCRVKVNAGKKKYVHVMWNIFTPHTRYFAFCINVCIRAQSTNIRVQHTHTYTHNVLISTTINPGSDKSTNLFKRIAYEIFLFAIFQPFTVQC